MTDPTSQESDRLLLAKELQDGLWPYVSYQVRGRLRVGGWGDAARSSFYKQGSERSCRGTRKLSLFNGRGSSLLAVCLACFCGVMQPSAHGSSSMARFLPLVLRPLGRRIALALC